jgi:hypothetical protein
MCDRELCIQFNANLRLNAVLRDLLFIEKTKQIKAITYVVIKSLGFLKLSTILIYLANNLFKLLVKLSIFTETAI